VAAARKEAEAGARRQRELLASLGVRDWTVEELDAKAHRRAG
jgi:hypothetical protein